MTITEILEESYQEWPTFDLMTIYMHSDEVALKSAAKSVLRARFERMDTVLGIDATGLSDGQ